MANQWKIQAPLMQTPQDEFGLEMSAAMAIEQNED